MSTLPSNFPFSFIGEELKKASANYQQQHQALQKNVVLPVGKTIVRNKNKSGDLKLKYSEGMMKLQLFLLALFLAVIWMVLLLV